MMVKRDLKADLEELESLKENDVHFMSIVCFIENNAEKWLEQGVVELERAIKAERLKDMLVKYNKFLVAEVLNKRERSEQLEALARELVAALREISEILDNATCRCRCGFCEYFNAQKRADKALAKAKEVLGDD
jgi:hypothetical protein